MPQSADFDVDRSKNEFAGISMSSESLNEILGDCMPRLFRIADSVLHNNHDSEDALQDGLLSALRHIDQFRGQAQFSTWVHSIVRNSALDKLRRQRAHPTLSLDVSGPEREPDWNPPNLPVDSGPNPERQCAQSEVSELFAQTLQGLPRNHQAIIQLCDFEGFSGREAAQRLGLSVSALKAQHHRARRSIRKSLSVVVARQGI